MTYAHSHDDERSTPLGRSTEAAQTASPPARAGMVNANLLGGEARITVHRDSPGDVGFREVFVSLDGEQLAVLEANETFTVKVKPGSHHLRADNTLFWKTRDLVLRPGEHARFAVINRAGFGTYALMILGAAPLYLTFERDE